MTGRVLEQASVTFLFTDIEGSTRLLEEHPRAYSEALPRHDALLSRAVEEQGGRVFKTVGDAICAAFDDAPGAVAAALAAQRALASEGWGELGSLRVRMGLHTGEVERRGSDFFGPPLHRCARVSAVAYGGQVLLSSATAEATRGALPEGAGLRPLGTHRLKDLATPEQIFQLTHPLLDDEFPPLRTLSTLLNNLPSDLTHFVGRERELAEATRLLGTTRLLTLTGSGGTGKTRLALEVAGRVLDGYKDGVWFVDLAPLVDAALVATTVAETLQVREDGRPIATTLAEHLRDRQLLMVLDNCEHLVDACARLLQPLLSASRHLRVLATSIQPLGVDGETTWRVPPLALPDAEHLPSLERLLDYAAVRLFVERAAAVKPGSTLTAENAAAIVQICRRLDGIPLAIELAAARVKVLSPEQIASRLDDRFRLLTAGGRAALPRRQTLAALIDWSHELLSPAERVLFRRLATFAGGSTLPDTETVCAFDGVEPFDVIDLLAGLVDKSLVVAEDLRGEPRYRLLESIRQFGASKLADAGEDGTAQERHADLFVRLSERAGHEWGGPNEASWVDRIALEHDNVRAALAWCEHTDATRLATAAAALARFWALRGHLAEGRRWLEAALAGYTERDRLRTAALEGGALLARLQGDLSGAQERAAEMLELARSTADDLSAGRALDTLGVLAQIRGELQKAKVLLEESLALSRAGGPRRDTALVLSHLAVTAMLAGDRDGARRAYEESLRIARGLGDRRLAATNLGSLANLLLNETAAPEEHIKARRMLEESLAILRELGYVSEIARGLSRLAAIARADGDRAKARELLTESVALARGTGDPASAGWSIANLANLARSEGDQARALGLAGEADALAVASGDRALRAYVMWIGGMLEKADEGRVRSIAAATAVHPIVADPFVPGANVSSVLDADEAAECAAILAEARTRLGEERFRCAWLEGRTS